MKYLATLLCSLLLFASAAMAQDAGYPKVKIHGLTFGDFFYNASSYNPSNKDINGVRINRVYFTGDFTLSKEFSSRFRLETDQIGSGGGKAEFGVMVKDAWLKWHNVFSGSDLIFGISPTPAFDVSEGAWGHRYLEKTIMDFNHIVSSRDMGIDLKGKFDESGKVKYWVKIGNNSGNKPESDKYKRYYGLLEFNPSSNLLITVYGDYASAHQVKAPDGSMANNSAFVGAAFLNYREKGVFSIGLEGFIKSQQNNYLSEDGLSLTTQSGHGISIWAYANLTPTVQIVGRFDNVDPNTAGYGSAKYDATNLILAGIQFNPIKKVSVTPNIEVLTHQAPSGVTNKSDVTPRVSFFWQF
jgi:hypothetical protein